MTQLSDSAFRFISDFARQHSGIVLGDGKQYLVQNRLEPLLPSVNMHSFDELVVALRSGTDRQLKARIIEALTTNETSFFRDLYPFQSLENVVLPQLIAARERERRINIWSAACSTGQEPYSLNMMLHTKFPMLQNWEVRITATDISTAALEKAQSGVYNQAEVNRGTPVAYLTKFFEMRGKEWFVKKELRTRIEFREMNLLQDWRGIAHMDLILLRNVLIYFSVETKSAILQRMKHVLAKDGCLVLGSTETTTQLCDGFEPINECRAGFYRLKSC